MRFANEQRGELFQAKFTSIEIIGSPEQLSGCKTYIDHHLRPEMDRASSTELRFPEFASGAVAVDAMMRPFPSLKLPPAAKCNGGLSGALAALWTQKRPPVNAMQKIEPQFRPDARADKVQPPIRMRSRQDPAAETKVGATNSRPHGASRRSGRPSNATGGPALLTGRAFTWIAGAVAAPLAFVIALWLTNPGSVPGVPALMNATVSDPASLMVAVQTAGLRGTSDVTGAIEETRRIDGELVVIRGWAADATSSGLPLAVIAFAGRAHLLTPTNDTFTELARLLGLSGAGAANISFRGTFACTRGDKIVVVAVTADRRYSQFRSLVCP